MGDTNKEALQQAARFAREQFDKTVRENIESIKQRNIRRNFERYGCPNCPAAKCYISCPRYLTHAEPEMLFRWWAKTSPADNRVKDYIQPMPAPPAKKGRSKSGRKRKKKKITDLRQWIIG